MANKAKVTLTATDKTRAAFSSAQRNVEGLQRSFRGMAGGIAALVGVAGLGALVRSTIDTSDKIQKLSISLGASTEALSQYQLVASRSGTTLDNLALIWQRQTRRIAEAAVGTGEARDALRELGLSAVDLAKLSPDRQFEVIADAMQNVTTQSDKLRLAFKLFDSEGARPALQAMEGGSVALRAMRDEAQAMGLTLTQVEADAIAGFNDEMKDSGLRLKAAAQRITILMLPALEKMTNALNGAANAVSFLTAQLQGGSGPAEILSNELADLLEEADELKESLSKTGNVSLIDTYINRLEVIGTRIPEIRKELDSLFRAGPTEAPEIDIGAPQGTIADEKAAKAAAEREAKELERLQAQQEKRLAMILEYAQTEQEQLQDNHDERILFLEEAYQNELIGFETLQDVKLQLTAQFEERRRKLEEKASDKRIKIGGKEYKDSIKGLRDFVGDQLTIGAQHSRAMFNLRKVQALSEAALSFRESVVDAYKFGNKFGGPPLGAAMAAIATAAQLANMAAIASTSFGGGSGGGGGSGNSTPVFDADPTFGLPLDSAGGRGTRTDVTINLGNAGIFSAEAVRNLIEQINEQIDDGVQLGGIVVA